jgi:hypothetical protein
VGIELVVVIQVETIEIIVEETCLERYGILAFHILSFSKDFKDGIQNIKGVMLKGWDDYMIWMNRAFRTRIAHGTL